MTPMGEAPRLFKATDITTGRVLAARVRIADDFRSRSIGLLNRASIDQDEALLIKPCSSIHTFFMKFPIDAYFLDKNGKILKIYEGLRPGRLAGVFLGGYSVLETVAGKSKATSSSVGNIVKID